MKNKKKKKRRDVHFLADLSNGIKIFLRKAGLKWSGPALKPTWLLNERSSTSKGPLPHFTSVQPQKCVIRLSFRDEFQSANARSLFPHSCLDNSRGPTSHGELFGLLPSFQGSTRVKTYKSLPFPITVRARPAGGTCTLAHHHLLQKIIRWPSTAMRSCSSLGTLSMASHMAIRSAFACLTVLFPSSSAASM
jgi:hypothetical protein